MIVKKLKLENIRSYKSQVVDFPLGKTLFEGDIGSGKSTILMAIEFALFGLGSEKPASLLKAGESEGSVSIIFESDGKEYIVQRRLVKKRNAYVQDDCVLKADGTVKQYSATEIKEKVLEILDFNEPPDPKAQSVIYRYAIYTPQEEIKTVLALKPDLRLQTLRKAFRIEDYKVASENAKNLSGEIKQRVRDFERDASEIQSIKEKIQQLVSSIAEKSEELGRIQKQHEEKKALLTELKESRERLQAERLALRAETGKIETLTLVIEDKKREIESSTRQIHTLESKLKLIEPKINELRSLKDPSEKTLENLQDEIQDQENSERELRASETRIKSKLDDYKSILEEKICPTCDQPIETNSFSEKLNHKQKELKASHERVEECSKALLQLKRLQDAKRNYNQAQSNLKEFVRNHAEYSDDLETYRNRVEAASKTFEESTRKLAQAKVSIQKLEKISSELDAMKSKIDDCDGELQEINSRIGQNKAHITDWERESKDLEKSVKQKIEQKGKADKLNEYMIWIMDYFMPTVEMIEKQVLMNINLEFDSQFQKWFGMLVDDPGKQAKIDEDFTPIIQQDGIDQEVSYLSGGEKTSVALAYRLALNSIVRKVSTGMHSNVLILDEPTDGFSKEQLGRVREILDELQCPQIILVSHEKELESFADQIFRVSKTDGISTITAGR